jgi:hypothetical protein
MTLLTQSTLGTVQVITPDVLGLRRAGAEPLPRWAASRDTTTILSSGVARFSYFTAQRTEPVTQIEMTSGGTAAAATPSLIRFGLYSVAPNGDLTQIAATPNDTSLFAATETAYPKALSSGVTLLQGNRYVVGGLLVTAATPPSVFSALIPSGVEAGVTPKLSAVLTGQSDLASSYTAGQMTATQHMVYAAVLP